MKPAPTARRHGATSRLGGVPTVPGPSATGADRQLAMPFPADEDRDRPRREVLPAVVHVPDWLDLDAQRRLVAAFRQWARPRPGYATPGCRPAT